MRRSSKDSSERENCTVEDRSAWNCAKEVSVLKSDDVASNAGFGCVISSDCPDVGLVRVGNIEFIDLCADGVEGRTKFTQRRCEGR